MLSWWLLPWRRSEDNERQRDCQQKKVIDLKDGMMPRKSNMDKSMLKSLHLPAWYARRFMVRWKHNREIMKLGERRWGRWKITGWLVSHWEEWPLNTMIIHKRRNFGNTSVRAQESNRVGWVISNCLIVPRQPAARGCCKIAPLQNVENRRIHRTNRAECWKLKGRFQKQVQQSWASV